MNKNFFFLTRVAIRAFFAASSVALLLLTVNTGQGVIPPAPEDNGPKLGFENFEGPGALTTVVTSSQGQPVNTVEYIAHDAGEPSIGVNWNTNVTALQSDLPTLFVTFNDSCNPASPKATWVNRGAPTSQGVDQDPIGF